jgi:hypothetical protein
MSNTTTLWHTVACPWISSMDWSMTPLVPSHRFLFLCNQTQDKSIFIRLVLFLKESVQNIFLLLIKQNHLWIPMGYMKSTWFHSRRVPGRAAYLARVEVSIGRCHRGKTRGWGASVGKRHPVKQQGVLCGGDVEQGERVPAWMQRWATERGVYVEARRRGQCCW